MPNDTVMNSCPTQLLSSHLSLVQTSDITTQRKVHYFSLCHHVLTMSLCPVVHTGDIKHQREVFFCICVSLPFCRYVASVKQALDLVRFYKRQSRTMKGFKYRIKTYGHN